MIDPSAVIPAVLLALAQPATSGAETAATGTPAPSASAAPSTLQGLFAQSFDLFTVLLLVGSVIAVAVIIRCVLEVREAVILPRAAEGMIRKLIAERKFDELKGFVARDNAFLSIVVRAALDVPGGVETGDRQAMRDAAELAASEQCANWFGRIEPLNIIGNMGPLLGLAGTVWGMIIAFAALGQTGGQANPATLSAGIAKALFHTLLGLMLAVPALLAFGFYRRVVDKHCNRAMVLASELVEQLSAAAPIADSQAPARANGGTPREPALVGR